MKKNTISKKQNQQDKTLFSPPHFIWHGTGKYELLIVAISVPESLLQIISLLPYSEGLLMKNEEISSNIGVDITEEKFENLLLEYHGSQCCGD